MTCIVQDVSVYADGTVHNHKDIHIQEGVISSIEDHRPGATGDMHVDGAGCLAIPAFKNGHTHAAMTLLRGYGDDMPLHRWLQECIWPAEAQLTEEDIYWGTRLAAIEMIRSGTTFANDMYFQPPAVIRAFHDSGIRAAVGLAMFDFFDSHRRTAMQHEVETTLSRFLPGLSSHTNQHARRVFLTIAPHSIYTCSDELLQWAAARAGETGLVMHIHMAETRREVDDCIARTGTTPILWLDRLGVLEKTASRMVAAHSVWISDAEHRLIQQTGLTVAHNPASNMKLASGAFPYQHFSRNGVPMMLAPDGVASNNSLDMFDEMKLAALLQKHHTGDPTVLPAEEILAMATGSRSTVFAPWGVGGALQPGEPADVVLIDLDNPRMVPLHNPASNLVYAAGESAVKTVLCGGAVVMGDGIIPGEDEVVREARRCAEQLVQRASR